MRVDVPAAPSGIAFAGAGADAALNQATWVVEGTIPRLDFAPGDTVSIQGTYTLLVANASGNDPRLSLGVNQELLSGTNGEPGTAYAMFDSAVMTPTGLPIERFPYFGESSAAQVPLVFSGDRWTASFTVELGVPADRNAGWYLPRLGAGVSGIPTPPLDTSVARTTFVSQMRGLAGKILLPPIRVGSPAPARIPAVLLAVDPIEGRRGVVALEDRDRYALANHVTTSSDLFVAPRTDPRTGAQLHYRLEPFLVTMGVTDRGGPASPPLIPFRLPSGRLTATVRAPGGSTRVLGPAPFRQWHLFGPVGPSGETMEGGPHLCEPFELRTLDPAFDVTFAEEGTHVVTLEGAVEDLYGREWRVGGTYEIEVARSLVIDPATLPGTPLETGDVLAAGLQLYPPVPAQVEVRVRHTGAGPASDDRFTASANRFGHLVLPAAIRLDQPGEYRVDIVARHRAADGSVRVGAVTWGSVVAAPDAPVIAHGRRGIDQQQTEKQQWYFRTQTGDPIGGSHVQFPFHSGDVAWLQESDSSIPIVTFQDPGGSLLALFDQLRQATTPQLIDVSKGAIGEAPLFSGNLSGREPHLDPANVDVWGYSYRSVQRPLVRVREQIGEHPAEAYWRFNDQYGLQAGSGRNGDLPNDFKFQFGGVVLRGKRGDPPVYAIYGSLFVLVPDDDIDGGTRVFPPFQGNGGGPSGGPLFRLKGEEIDLFFHPTGVRPGTILHRGQRVSFAGYSAPTLPSKVEITVMSPSGVVKTIEGEANAIGWFHDPAQDFHAYEPGVWKARVRITFDGRTSGGQVTEPFPTGGVLGSRDGVFYFSVVAADAEQLEVAAPGAEPQCQRPADGPITFTIGKPAGMTNATLTYTTTMPGFVLEEGTKTSLSYTYDAPELARSFPNLDLFEGYGRAGADTIAISLLLSGTVSGKTRHFARQIVIQGEELQMPDQSPRPKRRAARK